MKSIVYKLLCILLCFSLLFMLSGCEILISDNDKDDGKDDGKDNDKDDDKDDGKDNDKDDDESSFVPEDGRCYVVFTVKNFGKITVELLPEYAPITVEHFIEVVNSGFYSGTTFHRILSDFMIQGGAPKSDSPSISPIVGEFASNGYTENTLSHERGVISMARTSAPNSATTQFFICNADYPSLDGQYAAFGRVVDGMDVVDAITEHGMKYTSYYENGMIYDESKQPVIKSAVIIDNR